MITNANENHSESFKSVKNLKKSKKKNLLQPSFRKTLKEKCKSSNGDEFKVKPPTSKDISKKKYKLIVQTHKKLGLNCDKEFLETFNDADEIYIEKTLYLEYSSIEKANKNKQIIEKLKLDGNSINVEFWTKQKNLKTNSDAFTSYSLSVDVPQTASISTMKCLFPDAFHFIKRKRKKDRKKYFIVKYSTKEEAEKDLERSCTLTIDGVGINAKLRIAADQQLSTAPLSAKERNKQLREKINRKLEKINKLKRKKKSKKEKEII